MLTARLGGDFNGDGFDDLAVGAPNDLVNGVVSGSVSVFYGSAAGISATGNQLWSLESSGINGVAQAGDFFGGTLATGDFNGDGYDDLAIGSSARTVSGKTFAGAVNVIYGSASGLRATGDQQFTQDTAGIVDSAEQDDRFGISLAAGDFNQDGWDDLAIGSLEGYGATGNAGGVHVLYGANGGLSTTNSQFWNQDSSGINDKIEADDKFGLSLAVGDFNNDGRDDLAVGVGGESLGGLSRCGAVAIIYGRSSGLHASGDQFFDQATAGIAGSRQQQEEWSRELAAGDFNGDGFDDLAAGTPWANVSGASFAGEVNILYGSAAKITVTGSQRFTAVAFGMLHANNLNFCASLVAGDFNDDNRDDLAIGITGYDVILNDGEIVDPIDFAGAVHVAYGAVAGLQPNNTRFDSGAQGMAGAAEVGDRVGNALTSGDYNGDGRDDLAIGVAQENVFATVDGGAILVLYGTSTFGLDESGSQEWSRETADVLGDAITGLLFGSALA